MPPTAMVTLTLTVTAMRRPLPPPPRLRPAPPPPSHPAARPIPSSLSRLSHARPHPPLLLRQAPGPALAPATRATPAPATATATARRSARAASSFLLRPTCLRHLTRPQLRALTRPCPNIHPLPPTTAPSSTRLSCRPHLPLHLHLPLPLLLSSRTQPLLHAQDQQRTSRGYGRYRCRLAATPAPAPAHLAALHSCPAQPAGTLPRSLRRCRPIRLRRCFHINRAPPALARAPPLASVLCPALLTPANHQRPCRCRLADRQPSGRSLRLSCRFTLLRAAPPPCPAHGCQQQMTRGPSQPSRRTDRPCTLLIPSAWPARPRRTYLALFHSYGSPLPVQASRDHQPRDPHPLPLAFRQTSTSLARPMCAHPPQCPMRPRQRSKVHSAHQARQKDRFGRCTLGLQWKAAMPILSPSAPILSPSASPHSLR